MSAQDRPYTISKYRAGRHAHRILHHLDAEGPLTSGALKDFEPNPESRQKLHFKLDALRVDALAMKSGACWRITAKGREVLSHLNRLGEPFPGAIRTSVRVFSR